MQNEFYKLSRTYTGEGEGDFLDVLPKDLTLQKVNWYDSSNPRQVTPLMFKEVNIKPYRQHHMVEELSSIRPKSSQKWTKSVYGVLKDIVFRAWDPDRFHVVAHSGGVDSRILSTIIKELSEQHGREWLGEVLFVENGGECDTFKLIMKSEGWDEKQYISYKEGVDPHEFHRDGLNFKNHYRKFNGVSGYPFNLFYDCYDGLIDMGVIPEVFQGFAAFGCYIDLAFRHMSVREWFEWNYYYQFHSFNTRGEFIFPWWHYDYMRELAKYKQVRELGRVRVSAMLNPLPKIPNVPYSDILKRGFRHLSPELFEDVMVDFFKSWYGRRITPSPDNEISYQSWWGEYCEASICEHLISKGYNI